MANKIDDPSDKPVVQGRDGSWLRDQYVDSGKVLSAFRETVADRQHMTFESERAESSPAKGSRESEVGIADNAPDLNSKSVAKEFVALTRDHQTRVKTKKPPLARLDRSRSGPDFER